MSFELRQLLSIQNSKLIIQHFLSGLSTKSPKGTPRIYAEEALAASAIALLCDSAYRQCGIMRTSQSSPDHRRWLSPGPSRPEREWHGSTNYTTKNFPLPSL